MFIEFLSGYLAYRSFESLSSETFLDVVQFAPEIRPQVGIREYPVDCLDRLVQQRLVLTDDFALAAAVWNEELGYI